MTATTSFHGTESKHLEIFSLIWLDSTIHEGRNTEQKLRSIINHFKKFQDIPLCQQYIEQTSSENDRLVLIVSGQLGREIVPSIHELRQVISIYIYCMDKKTNQQWSSKFSKIKNVVTNLDELVNCITEDHQIQKRIEEPFSINIFSTNAAGKSTTGLNGQFVFSQVLIDCLLRLKSNKIDKDELIELCQNEYQGNSSELNHLQEFKNKYCPDKALYWYTKESFFYRILNTALRTQNIHMIFLLRSFIFDIQQQLQKLQSNEVLQKVYRAQIISNDELNQLRQSIGQFISINSFFSTSKILHIPLTMLGETNSSINWERVLFEINADPKMVITKPFADVSQHSDFPNEFEVLFMAGSIFRLENIFRDEKQIWIIQMTLCSDDENDLKQVLKYMQQQTGNGPTNLRILGKVLWEMGKLDLAEKYIKRLSKKLELYDPLLSDLYEDLGKLASQAKDYEMSMQWHQKSLALKEQNRLSNQIMILYGSPRGNFKGGGLFNDANDLKLSALTYCVGIEVFWRPYLAAIRFIYDWDDTCYQKIYHGNCGDLLEGDLSVSSEKFFLSKDERFNRVILHVGTGETENLYMFTFGGKIIRYIMGIQFYTTSGRTTRLYGVKNEQEFIESYEGFTIGYVKGRSGLLLDSLQFVWYNETRCIKTYDDVWVEAEQGLIPVNAFIGGQEDDKCVYIVRFKSKEDNYIIGKLVEGNKSAEGSHFGVQTSSFYQVLINSDQKQKFKWMTTNGKKIPENAFVADKEEGNSVYVGRLFRSSGLTLISKFNVSQLPLFLTHDEHKKRRDHQFEVLCVF